MLRNRVAIWIGTGWRIQSEWGGDLLRNTHRLPVHLFSAVISRQTYACSQLESLAAKLTDGSFAPLITHLIEANKISRHEIEEIRAILDEEQDDGEQS